MKSETTASNSRQTAILLMSCPDQKGIVAKVSEFLYRHNANILHADQHQDAELKLFLMRVEWDLTQFSLDARSFAENFKPLTDELQIQWKLEFSSTRPRVAILASRHDHCLSDLLYRHRSGDLNCDIPLVISNHPENRPLADFHEIAYHEVQINLKAENPETEKKAAEAKILELLRSSQIDLVILARYMQILSPEFVKEYHHRIINIHHSFLPAFLGAKPYHRAYERGVKLIGATSHYVTEDLDDGPIIEQDVIRISHRDSVPDLVKKGKDLERLVLSRAVQWHLEHRVLIYQNRTVVFN
ncbi:MAG: formyltetrahydrofolate deformylase [Methylotenera sp.]|nr:formyltetrahydrofolate deformylase [Oligoflexia bacterium]